MAPTPTRRPSDAARRALAALFLLAGAAAPAAAQVAALPDELPLNRYAREGRPVDKVLVLGSVRAPGVWEVERGVDLVEFLAHLNAGASAVGLRGTGERRTTTVQVYRGPEGGARALVFEGDFRALVERRVTPPGLQANDLLVVEDVIHRRRDIGVTLAYINAAVGLSGLVFTLVNFIRQ